VNPRLQTKFHIGCCGWSYLAISEFKDKAQKPWKSKLQLYAQLLNAVEINSTFYKLPRLSTAEKWRSEVDDVNPQFEFTVKAYKGITHIKKFRGNEIYQYFQAMKELCVVLNAGVILFQSPPSFKPTDNNIVALESFFKSIDRGNLVLVWEPRGEWYERKDLIEDVCASCELVHCVDPLRAEPRLVNSAQCNYYRFHGFGIPSMYHYNFSEVELKEIIHKIRDYGLAKDAYLFFNNDACYSNALEMTSMLER
jgi:uncharacterized protein YecE (DUF72 family)